MVAATKSFAGADYFGLYALFGSRKPDGGVAEDYLRIPKRWKRLRIQQVNGHAWCQALSTTHTFGMTVATLAEDKALMLYATKFGGAFDHATALMYQGYRPYSYQFLKSSFLNSRSQSGWLRRSAI